MEKIEINNHQNLVENTEEIIYKDEFWVRPFVDLEKRLIIKEEEKSIKLRSEGKALVRDVTDIFIKELKEALEHETNVIIFITAVPGTGKTESANAIAKAIKYWIEYLKQIQCKIWFTFGFVETNEIADDLQEYDIVAQDEQDRIQGKDSQSLMHAVLNLQEIVFRRNKNCFILSSADDSTRMKNACHIILKPYAGNWNRRITKLIAISPETGKHLGYVHIPLLAINDPIKISHDRRELEYKAKVRKQKGYVSAGIDKKRLKIDVQRLIKAVLGHIAEKYSDINEANKELLRYYRKELLKTDLVLTEIPGSEHYQERVLNEVWRKFQRFQISIKREDKKKLQEIAELKKLEQELEKREEQERLEEILELELTELLPELIQEAVEKYKDQKNVRTVQLKTFFRLRKVSKENIDTAIGITYDKLSEIQLIIRESSNIQHSKVVVDGEIEFQLLKRVEDQSFIDTVYECMLSVTRKRITTKKLKDLHLQAWYLRYKEGANLDVLREEFRVKSKSSFSNNYDSGGWFAIVNKELLGHAVEDALIKSYYQDYKLISGNSEPDLFNEEQNKMIEVKARTRITKPKVDFLNQIEIDHIKTNGEVELCITFFEPQKTTIEFYKVKLIEKAPKEEK